MKSPEHVVKVFNQFNTLILQRDSNDQNDNQMQIKIVEVKNNFDKIDLEDEKDATAYRDVKIIIKLTKGAWSEYMEVQVLLDL